MIVWLHHVDGLLRADPWVTQVGRTRKRLLHLAGITAAFGMLYGGVMGSFCGPQGVRPLSMLFSALKVPLLLTATFVISLPSYFIINTLLGLRADFRQALRSLMAAQAGMTVVLASLGPLTILWYASSTDYPVSVLFNGILFAVATFGAHGLLRKLYAPLVRRDERHRWGLAAWLITYSFVGVQMGWMLRPFIGDPGMPVTFFRSGAWGNAYVAVIDMIVATFHP